MRVIALEEFVAEVLSVFPALKQTLGGLKCKR
jgi:hypothetical protein